MPQEKEVYTMTQLDNEFFEEYKRLDRLCSDMYSCQDEIRQYLEDMECQFSAGEKVVPQLDAGLPEAAGIAEAQKYSGTQCERISGMHRAGHRRC